MTVIDHIRDDTDASPAVAQVIRDYDVGEITRWVDSRDSRQDGLSLAVTPRVSVESFPRSFGEESTPKPAVPGMNAVVERLVDKLERSDATGEAASFRVGSVLDDMSTLTAVRGRAAIGRCPTRIIARQPCGAGVGLRQVLGSVAAGGLEWINSGNDAKRGIRGVRLDADGAVAEIRSMWGGSPVDDETLSARTLGALEPSDNGVCAVCATDHEPIPCCRNGRTQ